MGLFSSKDTTYRVTGTVPGWFGPRKVTKTVTGRRAAEREMTRMQRRGAGNVRRSRGPWWMA
jgi:hypothetical protein